MPIALATSVQRPKLAQTIDVPVSVTVANPTEADGSDSFTQYITHTFTPDAQTVACSADNADVTLTVAAADASKIRVGDVVSGTGITVGTVVTGVSGTTVTIDNATTQAIVSGNLTFTAPETTAKIMGLQGVFSVSGSTITLTLKGYRGDGTKTGGAGGTDAATVADMAEQFTQTIKLDLDTFLTAARKARVNS